VTAIGPIGLEYVDSKDEMIEEGQNRSQVAPKLRRERRTKMTPSSSTVFV
jgi:hypothetical protein